MKIEEHYPLQEIHTFHLPVKTRYYVEYDNIDELCSFLSESPLLEQYPCYHMGGGSNLLFLHDYPGVILHSAIRFIEQVSENGDSLVLRAGAGVVWDDFVKYCVENNWGGVENLSLIPGEVGASAVQNIGAYGIHRDGGTIPVTKKCDVPSRLREFEGGCGTVFQSDVGRCAESGHRNTSLEITRPR